MPEAARVGHKHSGGGNRPPSSAVDGSPNVFVGRAQVLRKDDPFEDGSRVQSGAPHVTINGKAAARKGDKVTGGAKVDQGCPRLKIGNGGGPGYGRTSGLQALRKSLAPTATEEDKIILCLTDIAEAEADGVWSENDRIGWRHLRELMFKWLQRPARHYPNIDPSPYWVDWDWVMSFARAINEYRSLTSKSYPWPNNI